MAPGWFSEHGEGFCEVCRFVVPLDRAGKISAHKRGQYDLYVPEPAPCAGTGTRPGPVPVEDPSSVFLLDGRMAVCPGCCRKVRVFAGGILEPHAVSRYDLSTVCDQSGKTV